MTLNLHIRCLFAIGLCLCSTIQAVQAETRHAVIIAVRDYPKAQQLPSLVGTQRDAERLRQVLLRGGFPDSNIVVVHESAADTSLRPTRQNILSSLDRTFAKAKAEDLVLVMTIGHGVAIRDVSYFCPSDATDAALDDAPLAESQLIKVSEITERLSKCLAEQRLLVVDACRNSLDGRVRGFVKPMQKPPEGMWLVSSCSESQQSYVSPKLQAGESHALFSYFLAEGLGGAADLLGNNNGEVSLFEMFSYAYTKTHEAAEELGEQQTPELFGGLAPPFNVAKIASFAPTRAVTTSDPEVERRQSAELVADQGIRIEQSSDVEFVNGFPMLAKSNNPQTELDLYRRHHNQLCYALGTYLRPALELDSNCRLARLGRGAIFRNCGMFQEALAEFEMAHEHLDLFVKGEYSSIQNYLAFEDGKQHADESGKPLLNLRSDGKQPLKQVSLRKQPNENSTVLRKIEAHSKIRVIKVKTSLRGDDEWLQVSAVNDNPLPEPGWLQRDDVHWFAEAADFHTPATPLTPGGGTTSNLSKLDNAVSEMNSVAARLDRPANRIGAVRQNIQQKMEGYNKARRIVGRFGYSLPDVGGQIDAPLAQAHSYASIPGNYVRMASGYVAMPNNYARMAQGWAGTSQRYYSGMARSNAAEQKRSVLIKARLLPPVQEKPITVASSPWADEL
ncbi:MAG: caspase family protein [Planctomycetaceae bacterium]|nr:caspase family protein [Planctomycetaceae bacterium]